MGGDTNCLDGAGLVRHCLLLTFVIGAFLGAAVTFGAGFLLLAFLLVLVTGAFLGASVITVGVGLRGGEGWALAIRPLGARGFTHLRGSAAQLTVGVEWALSGPLQRVRRFSLQAPQVPALQGPPWHPSN